MFNTVPICVRYANGFADKGEMLAERLDLPVSSISVSVETPFYLFLNQSGLSLCQTGKKPPGPIQVDFLGGSAGHRRRYGGGKGQMIAKAVGLNKSPKLSVLDMTAGMGGDGFVLASLGATVLLQERSPVVFELLQDGLNRALLSDDDELRVIASRISLKHQDSTLAGEIQDPVDVVYLDPMFPEKTKSAKVKKEMLAFHDLVGADEDSDQLLNPAIELAKYRVVVKRPRKSPFLGDNPPTYQLEGKTCRYDIYVNAAIP